MWQSQHVLRVCNVELGSVFLGQPQALDCLDSLANEQWPPFGIEGTIGAEQATVNAKEIEAAADGGARTVHGRVIVEQPEIIDGSLAARAHLRQQLGVVLVRGAAP